jgi:MoaA/NifB/PqqE/SkfB family radical SAM enzyme
MSIQQDQVLRPCCAWDFDQSWAMQNKIDSVDIAKWHLSDSVALKKQQLDNNQWPENCKSCSRRESEGNYNNMRSNGNSAYSHYNSDDIALEIRPGSVCNFACQTCWPEASSRVAKFQVEAGLINKRPTKSSISDFEFLNPIAHRIRDVILLGGEPFYDKNCKKFLEWSKQNLTANQIIFTNGLVVDYDFLKTYNGKLILVFSLDAVGQAAEYIRVGTVWDQVWKNYQQCKLIENVEVRVNVTTSVYNYPYLKTLFELLATDWPDLVTIGTAGEDYLQSKVIPAETRHLAIESLRGIDTIVQDLDIPLHQKQHVCNAINTIENELQTKEFDQKNYKYLVNYIQSLDRVKRLDIVNFCPEVATYLQISG